MVWQLEGLPPETYIDSSYGPDFKMQRVMDMPQMDKLYALWSTSSLLTET